MISQFNFKNIGSYLQEVFTRFPVSMVLCLASVLLWISFIANEGDEKVYLPLIISSSMGLIYTLAIHLAFESRPVKNAVKIAGWLLILLGLIIYYLSLRKAFSDNDPSYCTFFTMLGLGLAGVLLVSISQVWSSRDNQRYLLFNRHLFINYLLSTAYTIVLLIGFVLAVLALDKLFGVDVNEKIYGYLTVLFIGLFFTTYFLASIPRPDEKLEMTPSKGLKILAQYILVPIVMIYAFIILAYSIKNIFSPSLSEIWTQELIWWFYVAGYFTFLINLAVELPESLTNFGRFGKGFLYILLPLSILVMISIGINMHTEGITELKYIVASMSLYLLIISIYLLSVKNKDYRWVSQILLLFTIIAALGPLSACRTSIRNQESRLYTVLEKNNVIYDGGLSNTVPEISDEDLKTVKNSMNFLNRRKDSTILDLQNGPITHAQLQEIFGSVLNPDIKNYYVPYKNLTEISLTKYDSYIGFLDYPDDNLPGRYLQLSGDRQKMEWKDKNQIYKTYDLKKILTPVLRKDPVLQNRKIILDDSDIHLDFYVHEMSYRYEGNKFVVEFIRGFGLLSSNQD